MKLKMTTEDKTIADLKLFNKSISGSKWASKFYEKRDKNFNSAVGFVYKKLDLEIQSGLVLLFFPPMTIPLVATYSALSFVNAISNIVMANHKFFNLNSVFIK